MLLLFFALSGGGLLLWAAYHLYQLHRASRKSGTFCGRTASPGDCGHCEADCGPPTDTPVEQKINFFRHQGINTQTIEQQLQLLLHQTDEDHIHISVFGEISSGKSSLINLLLKDEKQQTAVTGGTTRSVRVFQWQESGSIAPQSIYLLDYPGHNDAAEPDEAEQALIEQGLLWSHVIIYVCTGDLSQSEITALKPLIQSGRPVLVALNKSDQYALQQIQQLQNQILSKLEALKTPFSQDICLAVISCGGSQDIKKVRASGEVEYQTIQRRPQLDALFAQLTGILQNYTPAALHKLRQQAVYHSLHLEIERLNEHYQQQQITGIISRIQQQVYDERLNHHPDSADDEQKAYLSQTANALCLQLAEHFDTRIKHTQLQRYTQNILDLTYQHSHYLLSLVHQVLQSLPQTQKNTDGSVLYPALYVMMLDFTGHLAAQQLRSSNRDFSPAAALVEQAFRQRSDQEWMESLRLFLHGLNS